MGFKAELSGRGSFGDQLNQEELTAYIAKYSIAGMTTLEIAKKLNITMGRVTRLRRLALADYRNPDIEVMRAIELMKLDSLERVIKDKVQDGNLSAVRTALAVIDTRAKMAGLNMVPKPMVEENQGPKVLEVVPFQGKNPHDDDGSTNDPASSKGEAEGVEEQDDDKDDLDDGADD